jgi:hypothetical protein
LRRFTEFEQNQSRFRKYLSECHIHNFKMLFFRCVHKIAEQNYELHRVCPSTLNTSAPTGWIFMKFDIGVFFKNLLRKFKLYKNLTKITGI